MGNLEDLKKLQERLNKKFGANSVVTMATFKEVPKLSSGILGVDRILGGGWAKGRIIEVAGPESSGKTTLVLETIANFHKNNPEGFAFYCDAESAFDPSYARSLGIDMDRLLLNQPQSAEEGYDLIKEGVRKILQDSSKKHNMSQGLYFELAEDFGFDIDLVDRAMRNAIDVSYKRGGICDFEKTYNIDFSSPKPTPKELICILSEKIMLDQNLSKKLSMRA